MEIILFYSWQSNTTPATNRSLIQQALEEAAEELRKDDTILVEPVVDRDTRSIPGSPDIAATIFRKIDSCNIFVGDVTIVSTDRESERTSPNPNVLIELGYALKALGPDRLILVQNTAYGQPSDLPFDLRNRRVLTYASAPESTSRAEERRRLRGQLKGAIVSILPLLKPPVPDSPPILFSLAHDVTERRKDYHGYKLIVTITNRSERTIKDWHIDASFPTPLLPSSYSHVARVARRSDARRSMFRVANDKRGDLLPGDSQSLSIDYCMDSRRYERRDELFSEKLVAQAYVDGTLAETIEESIEDLQEF